jgi:hypothetical protein
MKLNTEQFAAWSDDLFPAFWLDKVDATQNIIFEDASGQGDPITCICRHKGDAEV